jgi:hypothetical protein
MRRLCPKTGKVRYGSAVLARMALNDATARARGECRRYHCQFCGGWHLTSQAWEPGGSSKPTSTAGSGT